MHLDYVDIFYHHRPDFDTPLEETMTALDSIVRQGKALYVGISNYPADRTAEAVKILRDLGTPCLIHHVNYSIFNRSPETGGLLDTLKKERVGCIAFAPLNNGLLTNRYLHGIPADSRAAHDPRYLKPEAITEDRLSHIRKLNELAQARGESLAQLAMQWVLRDSVVTSALIGASRPEQIVENVKSLDFQPLEDTVLKKIDEICRA
jgi:L-glyceraldehyde 3-phosphate reductase